MTPDYMAYMLRYDTMHGQFQGEISFTDNSITVDGKTIKVFAAFKPEELPWGELGGGVYRGVHRPVPHQGEGPGHLTAGAKKVVMSAPSKDDTPMFVMGVNNTSYDPSMDFVSNASCTTNCLAPIAKVLHDNWASPRG